MIIVLIKKIYDKMIRLKYDGEFIIIFLGINLKFFYKLSYIFE